MTPEEMAKLGEESVKAVGKLSDLANTVLAPTIIKRQTKALINDVNKKADLIRNNPDMDISFTGGSVNIRQLSEMEIKERAQVRLQLKAIKQQENLERVIEHAYNDLQYADECSDENVDPDWWNRFEDYAEDISNDEMQIIWGKILSGEIKKPGSFSLRTLETVKNISTEEARAFEKLCSVIIHNNAYEAFIPNYDKTFEIIDLDYKQFLKLDNAGLLFAKSDLTYSFPLVNNNICLLIKDYAITMRGTNQGETVRIPVYALTETGNQLYKMMNHIPDLEKIEFFFEEIINENPNINKIECRQILWQNEKHIKCSNTAVFECNNDK